ncbi:hypothetical protein PFISCL1PPCAC_4381, partial [Pristionchus fissidentatus]
NLVSFQHSVDTFYGADDVDEVNVLPSIVSKSDPGCLQSEVPLKSLVNETISAQFSCRSCRRSFTNRSKMKKHERKHHKSDFACDKCPASYKTRDSLERHYSGKHSCRLDGSLIEKRELSCDGCEKKFGVRKELQAHAYYCSNKKSISKRRAEQKEKEKLRIPVNVLPCGPKAKIVKDKSCPICGLVCASMQSRHRHIGRIHREKYEKVMEEEDKYAPSRGQMYARPYTCGLCYKAF